MRAVRCDKDINVQMFSPTNSDKPYFIGKHLTKISKRLQSICPPDILERLPRDLEKHYSLFKATELQNWLLFYSLIPCMNGYLEDVYLQHLALLSKEISLLLGDIINSKTKKSKVLKFPQQTFEDLHIQI